MKILIIGSGGREYTLGWKLKQSPKVKKIFFAPGNGGTTQLGENVNIKASDIRELLRFAQTNQIDLTVVGPEDPLALGIVDLFNKHHLKIFGPSKKAARLESSKAWAAKFMKKYRIPQPQALIFKSYNQAYNYIDKFSRPGKIVIKASGLALGKGVILPSSKQEALDALKKMMIDKEFGDAGCEVVIQERLTGPELSVIAVTDGKTITPLLPAQDHKRIFDNDRGPNTGGMGAYAPVPFVTAKLMARIKKEILKPTINGMKKENCPFKGVLYAGLIITKDGPRVLEYNVRFGDPETQPVLTLLKTDLYEILSACTSNKLNQVKIRSHRASAVCVVLASAGYPGPYEKGVEIKGINKKYNKNIQVIHAGTAIKNNQIITNGGRVLGITASGKNIKQALRRAYSIINKNGIHFPGMQHRKDIGSKALIY